MFYCDAHIHLLPHMDNGPLSLDESLAMLDTLQRVRTRRLVLTPHFDCRTETCAHFLARRKESYGILRKQAGPLLNRVKCLLSAQVYLCPGVSQLPLLGRLCITNTRYLPIELPLSGIDRHTMAELVHIMHKRKLTPIIACAERYFLMYKLQDYEILSNLPNAVYQFTARALCDKPILYEAVRLLHTGHTVIIGSNAHGADHRGPIDEKMIEILENQCGKGVFQALSLKTAAFLKDAFSD